MAKPSPALPALLGPRPARRHLLEDVCDVRRRAALRVTVSHLPDRVVAKDARSARPQGCRGKVRYPGRKQALGAANAYRSTNPDDPDVDLMAAYKCRRGGCHGWHIGHDRKP